MREVKRRWEDLTITGNNQQEEEMETILIEIERYLMIVKNKDKAAFPNFLEIKKVWNQMTRQIQNLRVITLEAASKEKAREDRESIAAVRSEIQDNKARIHGLQGREGEEETRIRFEGEPSTTEATEPEEETQHEEENTGVDSEEGEEDPTEEGNLLQESWQKMQSFCQDWGLDCRMIMMVGLATTAVWALSTGVMITVIVQTARLTIRTRRIREYLDLRSTDTKQEDHD